MKKKSQIRLVARFSLSLKMTQYTNWFFFIQRKIKGRKNLVKRKTFNRLLIENAKNKWAIMSPPIFFLLFREGRKNLLKMIITNSICGKIMEVIFFSCAYARRDKECTRKFSKRFWGKLKALIGNWNYSSWTLISFLFSRSAKSFF